MGQAKWRSLAGPALAGNWKVCRFTSRSGDLVRLTSFLSLVVATETKL